MALSDRFITLEGIEGSGKTSAVAAIVETLEELGYEVLTTREPGGSVMAAKIRAILLDPENKALLPLAELFLYLADRAQHVEEVILPALALGKIVVCDRYADATVSYQGYARGLGAEKVARLNDYATDGLKPALTLLLDCEVQIGLSRAKKRVDSLEKGAPTEDRFEQEKVSFHERVRQGYLDIAKKEPERFELIDAAQNPEAVIAAVKSVIRHRFKSKGGPF